jgi:hypothetical protein
MYDASRPEAELEKTGAADGMKRGLSIHARSEPEVAQEIRGA